MRKKLEQGLFLCAGLSTRMRPLTLEIPKVLLPFGDKNIFQWTMQYLQTQGIRRVGVNLHHGATFMHSFLDQHTFDLDIQTFDEAQILGTGGGVKNMRSCITQDHFFVMNCDVMTDANLNELFAFHVDKKALVTMMLVPNPQDRYTKIYVDPQHHIPSILQPNPEHRYAGMFGGISIVSSDIFSMMPSQDAFCLVNHLFEPLARQGKNISGCQVDARWYDTGEIDLYNNAIATLEKNPLAWMK